MSSYTAPGSFLTSVIAGAFKDNIIRDRFRLMTMVDRLIRDYTVLGVSAGVMERHLFDVLVTADPTSTDTHRVLVKARLSAALNEASASDHSTQHVDRGFRQGPKRPRTEDDYEEAETSFRFRKRRRSSAVSGNAADDDTFQAASPKPANNAAGSLPELSPNNDVEKDQILPKGPSPADIIQIPASPPAASVRTGSVSTTPKWSSVDFDVYSTRSDNDSDDGVIAATTPDRTDEVQPTNESPHSTPHSCENDVRARSPIGWINVAHCVNQLDDGVIIVRTPDRVDQAQLLNESLHSTPRSSNRNITSLEDFRHSLQPGGVSLENEDDSEERGNDQSPHLG